MTEKNKTLVSLDTEIHSIVAPVDAPPVAILNPQSSLHCRLIFCECAAANLESIVALANNHTNDDVQTLASVFGNQLHPLLSMLQVLVAEVKNDGGAKS